MSEMAEVGVSHLPQLFYSVLPSTPPAPVSSEIGTAKKAEESIMRVVSETKGVFLDTLHLLLISHTIYVYAVSGFGNLQALLNPTWSILAHIIVTGISDGIVRGIFCHRIWILSNRNRWLCATIALSSGVAFGGSLAYPIKGFQLQTYSKLEDVSWLLYFSLSTILVTDCIIAATLCILLAARRTVFTRVDLTVRTLILYTVNTGALTTLCALVDLIAYAATPHSFVYITFYFLLPKLFLNSLLATLNARKSLREQMRADAVALSLELEFSPTYGGRTAFNEGLVNSPRRPENQEVIETKQ
ncbi:hypothetical protein BD311DRAFT_868694 [Dichomitus squalens]|uniref:DUF6534 domain-containing protein n=1 Tax=Dichomitus squalens TaxID=114155 RepID=A0A4Q9MAT3_9APHY|nr:hypothetical protein BD311DRAFT_868694 [Dichomitus squalens]